MGDRDARKWIHAKLAGGGAFRYMHLGIRPSVSCDLNMVYVNAVFLWGQWVWNGSPASCSMSWYCWCMVLFRAPSSMGCMCIKHRWKSCSGNTTQNTLYHLESHFLGLWLVSLSGWRRSSACIRLCCSWRAALISGLESDRTSNPFQNRQKSLSIQCLIGRVPDSIATIQCPVRAGNWRALRGRTLYGCCMGWSIGSLAVMLQCPHITEPNNRVCHELGDCSIMVASKGQEEDWGPQNTQQFVPTRVQTTDLPNARSTR